MLKWWARCTLGSFGVVSTDSLDGVWMNVSAGKKSGHDDLWIGADLCSLLCYSADQLPNSLRVISQVTGACVYDNVWGCAKAVVREYSEDITCFGATNFLPLQELPIRVHEDGSFSTGVVAVVIFWGSSSGLWWVAGVTGLWWFGGQQWIAWDWLCRCEGRYSVGLEEQIFTHRTPSLAPSMHKKKRERGTLIVLVILFSSLLIFKVSLQLETTYVWSCSVSYTNFYCHISTIKAHSEV